MNDFWGLGYFWWWFFEFAFGDCSSGNGWEGMQWFLQERAQLGFVILVYRWSDLFLFLLLIKSCLFSNWNVLDWMPVTRKEESARIMRKYEDRIPVWLLLLCNCQFCSLLCEIVCSLYGVNCLSNVVLFISRKRWIGLLGFVYCYMSPWSYNLLWIFVCSFFFTLVEFNNKLSCLACKFGYKREF